jgi:carboxymethylenebutenolidase
VTFRRYIAEEIAADCAEGLLSRRDALKRLLMMGLSLTAASALLAACGDDEDDAGTAAPATTTTAPAPATTAAGADEPGLVRFDGPDGELIASWAAATDAKGAVLIIHENRGLTPHFVALPGRLAADGYSALAVDLVSAEGGTAALSEGEAQAALANAPGDRLVADLRAGVDELARRAPGAKLGVVGFCFGGGMTWQLLAAGEDRLAAAVPFYGPTPTGADFSRATAAVLAIYAELDTRVNSTRDAAVAALERAGLEHEVRTFPGVDHAFFNDTGSRHDPDAAAQAYDAVLAGSVDTSTDAARRH